MQKSPALQVGSQNSPRLITYLAAFAAVYVIWGPTYLAIRIAIETLPPFLMAGVRFLLAGAILYLISAWKGAPRPTSVQLRNALIVGGLLLLGGNGAVVWAEQWVPSGLVALLVGTVPLWMVSFDWWFGDGARPGGLLLAGLLAGLLGVSVLVSGSDISLDGSRGLLGSLVVLAGAASWAGGSIFARGAETNPSRYRAVALQMILGGALLMILSLVVGEARSFRFDLVSMRSLLALVYLIVFGALVAYSAYIWLLDHSAPAKVATYAYVNPVVALFLGWALVGEPINARTLIAAAIILAAVAVVTAPYPKPQGKSEECVSKPTFE